MFHRIEKIEVLEGFDLKVTFVEGITKDYDISQLFERIPAFRRFEKYPYEIKNVKVDVGGYGIIWNDELDLSADEIWENGTIN